MVLLLTVVLVRNAEAEDGDRVALKVLRPELSDDKSFRERLAREAEALSKLQGDRTATVHHVVTDGDSGDGSSGWFEH